MPFSSLVTRLRSGIGLNSAASLGQALVGMLSLFFVYRQAIIIGGTELVGLWSLTVGLVSFARIADVSGGGALARLVAVADTDKDRAAVIDVVALFQLGFYLILCAIVIVPFLWAFGRIASDMPPETARLLITATLVALICNVVTFGQSNALDGMMRADLRALANIIGFLVFAGVALWLLPTQGVVGLAFAQIAQMCVTLVLVRFALCRLVPGLAMLPIRGTRTALKGAISYGLRLQAMGVAGLIFDPLSRFAITAVAGLETLGIYEIAYRLVAQTRSFLSAAATPIVPVFAKLHETDRDQAKQTLHRASRIFGYITVLGFATLCLLAPLAEYVLFPTPEPLFLPFVAGLAVGYIVNANTTPVFLYAQGVGILRWNIIGQLCIAIISVAAVWFLPQVTTVQAAPMGIAIGLTLGSFVIFFGNTRHFRLGGNIVMICRSLLGAIVVGLAAGFSILLWGLI